MGLDSHTGTSMGGCIVFLFFWLRKPVSLERTEPAVTPSTCCPLSHPSVPPSHRRTHLHRGRPFTCTPDLISNTFSQIPLMNAWSYYEHLTHAADELSTWAYHEHFLIYIQLMNQPHVLTLNTFSYMPLMKPKRRRYILYSVKSFSSLSMGLQHM